MENKAQGRTYMTGMRRDGTGDKTVTHLFDGNFKDPGKPMCQRGYDDDGGYSIFRGNIGNKGVCKVCERRAHLGLEGVEFNESASIHSRKSLDYKTPL